MTQDDYQQIRSQYADIDDLCKDVENSGAGDAIEAALGRLVQALGDQQRAPEQVRSFVTHLGAPEDVIGRVLGEGSTEPGDDLGFS